MEAEGLDPENPSLEVQLDMYAAMIAYNENEVFGPPTSAGTDELPVWWMEAVTCVKSAKAKAEEEQYRKNFMGPAEGVPDRVIDGGLRSITESEHVW